MRDDYYDLCSFRFEKWFQCDMVYYDKKIDFAKAKKPYPCFEKFYEAQYSCSDDMFDFLLELSYVRRINDINYDKFLNFELFRTPTIYDHPDETERIKYTY